MASWSTSDCSFCPCSREMEEENEQTTQPSWMVGQLTFLSESLQVLLCQPEPLLRGCLLFLLRLCLLQATPFTLWSSILIVVLT